MFVLLILDAEVHLFGTVTDHALPRLAASLLLELLSVKFGYFSISCLSKDDVAYAIDYSHLLIVVN